VTWIYPFDEYHDWTFGEKNRVNEVFFGDWFMRAAVNQGFPLNTVITTENFLKARQAKGSMFDETILVCPAPDAGSALAEALIAHLESGGRVLLYGPLHEADARLQALLNIKIGEPISGDLRIRTNLNLDTLGNGSFPEKLRFRELLSGGGLRELYPVDGITNGEALAEAFGEDVRRLFAASCVTAAGGVLGWVRGALSENADKHSMLPFKDDPKECFFSERLLRAVLEKFGIVLRFSKPTLDTLDPLILAARVRNGWTFSGFTPSTNVQLKWKLPDGVPVPVGCDVFIESDGCGSMALSRAWHRECRVFVQQSDPGEVSCAERTSGAVDVQRRLAVTGLKNATVIFYHDSSAIGARVRFQEEPPYPGLGRDIPSEAGTPGRTVAHNVSGTVLISQYKLLRLRAPKFDSHQQ